MGSYSNPTQSPNPDPVWLFCHLDCQRNSHSTIVFCSSSDHLLLSLYNSDEHSKLHILRNVVMFRGVPRKRLTCLNVKGYLWFQKPHQTTRHFKSSAAPLYHSLVTSPILKDTVSTSTETHKLRRRHATRAWQNSIIVSTYAPTKLPIMQTCSQ